MATLTKLLIGVMACHKKQYPNDKEPLLHSSGGTTELAVKAVRETWTKDAAPLGVDVRFFYGHGATRDPLPDEVFLNVDDSYLGLPDKVRFMFHWALRRGYTYTMKTDVDSYVNVRNLLNSDFRTFAWTSSASQLGSGLGYILSRKAMQAVVDCKIKTSWAEDEHVGHVLREAGMRPHVDTRYCFAEASRNFIVLNPCTPEAMYALHAGGVVYRNTLTPAPTTPLTDGRNEFVKELAQPSPFVDVLREQLSLARIAAINADATRA